MQVVRAIGSSMTVLLTHTRWQSLLSTCMFSLLTAVCS